METSSARRTVPSYSAKNPNYTVHPAPNPVDGPGFALFGRNGMFAAMLTMPVLVSVLTTGSVSLVSFGIWFALLLIPTYAVYMVVDSYWKNWAFYLGYKVRLWSGVPLLVTRIL